MALTQNDKLAFRMMYHVSMASRMAEKSGLNTWGEIGTVLSRAEGEACRGGHQNPALRGECKVLADWIANHQDHQGHRKKVVPLKDVETLRSKLVDMTSDLRNRNLRHAGLWLGYAFGTCGLSLLDEIDRSEELRDNITNLRKFLVKVDIGMNNWIDPVETEANKKVPNYKTAQNFIEKVFNRI